jgi:hypothetical protein
MATMTKLKRRLLAVAVLTTVALGAVWMLWPEQEPAIGPESYRRIRLGMTQAEIEAAIGIPPGIYSRHSKVSQWVSRTLVEQRGIRPLQDGEYSLEKPRPGVEWIGDVYVIEVVFEHELATCCVLWDATAERPLGILDRIRSWLGW